MRIIAGNRARTQLIGPKDLKTRPITDRVKEALFNIIQFQIEGARVVDLFCGTGSLGLEAASRGAESVLMVDNDTDAIKRLKQNIHKCGFQKTVKPLQCDIFSHGIPGMDSNHLKEDVDIVFIDPPYPLTRDTSLDSKLGGMLLRIGDQIGKNTIIMLRHEKKTKLLERYGILKLVDQRKYGDMVLTFMEQSSG